MHEHDNKPRGWIGVDFDATLATYSAWVGVEHTGEAIPAMVERVKRWRREGREVRIFTARVYPLLCVMPGDDVTEAARVEHPFRGQDSETAVRVIREWCLRHLGEVLPVTCVKDYAMVELWDDRAVQVQANTGEPVGYSAAGLA